MNTATIEVRFADPPKDGKKQGTIKTATGEMFGVWPDKLGLLQPGRTYEVEFSERPYKGRVYKTIIKCKPVDQIRSEAQPERVTTVKTATPEQQFVTACLGSAIESQQVEMNDKSLHDAVMLLRVVWGKTFGRFS